MDYPPANLTALKQIARGYQNTGSDCSWQEVERAIAEIERLRAYEKEWLAASDACSWMHDDKTLDVPLGRRLTVEGVTALRKQRDELRASQMVWRKVTHESPSDADGKNFLFSHGGCGAVPFVSTKPQFAWQAKNAPWWMPIPPLPGPTQEDQDEELFREWCNSREAGLPIIPNAKAPFLAGLKAGREQKAP